MNQIYLELHQIAVGKMAPERDGHTLQATALIHEAWLRLLKQGNQRFENRRHFFAAAAESMRRILIESARKRSRQKRTAPTNPEIQEEHSPLLPVSDDPPPEQILEVHDAIEALALHDETAANLVKLRYFAGMTMQEAASAMDLPLRTTERQWTYARAWLRRHLSKPQDATGLTL